jgi:hypothetical protein
MDQQVIGNVVGMEQRNGGWVAVAILVPGKEHPVKLSTKKQELISQAQQMMGQLVTAGYNEQESTNINPHNNQPYTNRYLEAIAFGQVDLVGSPTQIQPQQFMPQPQAQPQQQFQGQPQTFAGQPAAQPFVPQPQPVIQPQPQPIMVVNEDLRESRIMRQAAAKVAVQLLQHLEPEARKLASLVAISEQLVGYFRDGVQWQVPPVQQPVQQQPQQQFQGEAHDAQAQQAYQQHVQAQQRQGGYENPAEGGDPGPQYGDPGYDDSIPF